jgi:hypothetical protein
MSSFRIFTCVATLSLCITYVGALSDANAGGGNARELAPASGTVSVDGAELSARLFQIEDKVFARFTAANLRAEATTLDVEYAVFRTAPVSMMARMMPFPEHVAGGSCAITVAANGTVDHTILVQENAPLPSPVHTLDLEPTLESISPELFMGEATWSLVVSRKDIPEAFGWGAVPPSVGDPAELGDEQVVLAASPLEMPVEIMPPLVKS